ncbi:hypothetical protein ACIQRS_24515 [Streptomyces termitum]|uniref:hypothetical protein n=1 Tax=Streptomyces termitum TaxID=67368 RepID=UPI001675733C|nr:hypothetical protein [Streptomyces termitum]
MGTPPVTGSTAPDHARLRAMAHRLLASSPEAEEAVRATERILSSYGPGPRARRGPGPVPDPGPPPETVLARVCLGRLRARETRHTAPWDPWSSPAPFSPTPAERLILVLHDDFGVPYEDLAPALERAPAALRQTATRARAHHPDAAPTTTSPASTPSPTPPTWRP